ncbi:hypothetical protein GGX14DRAFT_628071 [Mycena pura]|uniref:Methyltransferase domain-containing protein n=1 Tax=Mycena pura TaxID=153505 RepID=A0AAD6YRF0_9AGAR|nr:hypothetical protein GGX14DRAFT_628071 [Mycena pura]
MSQCEPADDIHYVLDPEELTFLKKETGIEDEDALKAHVLAIQRDAKKVYAYPCIRRFGFVRLKICKLKSAYEHVLEIGRSVPGAVLLDLGCCFGTDLRKIASDGFPIRNIIASDLRRDFWDLGHKVFRSTPDTFPVTFVEGDAMDQFFLPLYPLVKGEPEGAVPDLASLKSFIGLQGRLSAIHSASLFHLFGEAMQLELARKLAGLLSPHPGSMIFGCHAGQPTKGYTPASPGKYMFCHTPESWREMWDGEVFEKGSVEVVTHLKLVGKLLNPTTDFYMMFWSIKRV